jgi:hypothetical protein
MGLLSSGDLQYPYSNTATANDNPNLRGEPDRTFVNRHEKYEVLYFINKLAEINGWKQKETGLKAERLIKLYLPPNIRSRENITRWLENNWDNFNSTL